MATDYTLTIPAGVKSALGNSLGETKIYKFSTPALRLINFYPKGESQSRDALMFLEFDQRIDAARLLKKNQIANGVECRAFAACDAG